MRLALNLGTDWGLTDKGFLAPTYEEILDSVMEDFKSRFGSDIALGSNSNFGIIARLIAWREYSLIKQTQEVYYSGFVSRATGTALDRLGANVGVPRKVATNSFAEVKIVTDGQYLLQAGEQFETEDGIVFNLQEDCLTEQNSDGSWSGMGSLISDDKGADQNVPANSITIESNPDENVLSVTNPEPARGGQDYEADDIYRARMRIENANRPGPTRDGIKSALLELPGVRQAFIKDNKKDVTDEYGNPPASVHVYVLGGDKKQIAQAIEDHRAVGTDYVGTESVPVADSTGEVESINFDFAIPVQIYAHVTISVSDEFDQDNGIDNVKQSIADAINALDMGIEIRTTKLYPAIYQIAGITDAKIEVGTSQNSLSTDNVPIKVFQAPVCDPKNIEVTVNGL